MSIYTINTEQVSENICQYDKNIVATVLKDLFRSCVTIPNDYFIAKVHPNGSYTISGLRQFLATESPLKMTKNAISPQKLFLFSRYLNISLGFLVI